VTNTVFFAVLFAALMHAGWNALIKQRDDRFLSISALGMGQGVIALCCTPFVAFPHAESWAWIFTSAALHTGYKLFLIRAYTAGELGQVYPLARGTAPLISSLAAFLILGEALSPFIWVGIFTLCFGIALMSLKGGAGLASLDREALGYALVTSVFIAGYTLVDAVGARGAVAPSSYIVWMFVFDGFTIAAVYAGVRKGAGLAPVLREVPVGFASAAMSLGAYWLVIWSMTRAPIGAVAALRETSILFAVAISMLVLKEKATVWRIGAASLILAGVVLMRAG